MLGSQNQVVERAPRRWVGRLVLEQLGIAEDGRELIVEVVGDAARQSPDRVEALGPGEVGLKPTFLRDVARDPDIAQARAFQGRNRAAEQNELSRLGPDDLDLDVGQQLSLRAQTVELVQPLGASLHTGRE
jgi:hypothetical protein